MDRVKADILSFMAESGADVGHALAERPFYFQRAINYTPPEKDQIGPALGSLVSEGLLEKRNSSYFLTENGFACIYPGGEAQAVDEVIADILDSFRSSGARIGAVLNARAFNVTYAIQYNPPKKRAIEKAVAALVQEGVLEQRQDNLFLTQTGYERIYAA